MTTTETTPGTPAAGTTGGTATAGATTTRSRTPRARTTTPRTPAPAPAPSPEKKEEHRPQLDLNLPFLRIQLRAPEMHMPHVGMPHISGRDVGHAVDMARTFLPPPERIMYYGGLGALAALGILEWPVAAAIGAGTMIAQRAKSREQRWSPLGAPQKETRGTAMPAPGAGTTEEPAARATAGRRTTTAKSEAKTPAATAARRTKAGAK